MKIEAKIMLLSAIAGGALTVGASFLISEVIRPQPVLTIPYDLPQESSQPRFTQTRNFIRVIKTNDVVETTKDPIWRVELVLDNRVVESVDALIGRSYRQSFDRNVSGNKSPLPQGRYSIDLQGIAKAPFDEVELGKGYWIPVSPLFSTGRSALGIHQDPSWGKTNGESGTSGCIGLKSPEDTAKLVEWVRKYNLQDLVVVS